jgi:hypothetical protein
MKDISGIIIHLDFRGPAMVGLGLHQEPVYRVPGLNEATWEIGVVFRRPTGKSMPSTVWMGVLMVIDETNRRGSRERLRFCVKGEEGR